MLNVFSKKIKSARKNYLQTRVHDPKYQEEEKRERNKKKKQPYKRKTTALDRLENYAIRYSQQEEIQQLETRIQKEVPKHNTLPPLDVETGFAELPISEKTKKGLAQNGFLKTTPIQRATLPHALYGRDILGAAQTGSGKTLAFLIPILEKLYRERWTPLDGLGAIVISPTKELAIQIFEVLRQVGYFHQFSAALLTGGGGEKRVREESERVHGMNIIICTPSRLLQHFDQSPSFHFENLQMLVLDEADRMLEMGFYDTLQALLTHLPSQRQTLLFSATQTNDIQDLARLGMKDPEDISVGNAKSSPIPASLNQYMIECQLEDKINTLWSFLKTHKKHKILIFFNTKKQVKYIYQVFKMLKPGIPILCLHGSQSAEKRMELFYDFCGRQHAALFTTDVGARGLDFPNVDWVFQVDQPDDVRKYIHRVGRTARLDQNGNSLLLLMPQEREFVGVLKKSGVELKQLKVNPDANQNLAPSLQSILIRNPELMDDAKKAFSVYLRSYFYVQNSKEKLTSLNLVGYSKSLGLAVEPTLNFTVEDEQKKGVFGFKKTDTLTPEERVKLKERKLNKFDKLTHKQQRISPAEAHAAPQEALNEEEEFFSVKKEGTVISQLPDDFETPSESEASEDNENHLQFRSDSDSQEEDEQSDDESSKDESDDNEGESDDNESSDDQSEEEHHAAHFKKKQTLNLVPQTKKTLQKQQPKKQSPTTVKKMKMEELEAEALRFLK